MMKNRDTASNPYRVPRQPTSKWVKVSIVMLFLCNVALMGSVVYLIFSTQQCTSACVKNNQPHTNGQKVISPDVKLMKDEADSAIERQQNSVRMLSRTVENVVATVSRLQTQIKDLDSFCRTIARETTAPNDGTISTHDASLIPQQSSVLEKLSQMDMQITNMNFKLQEHISASEQLCKEGHYRYGMYCFYVGEAALSQAQAKLFCSNDYDVKASLVVIKDKFKHDFIVAKLPNTLHSYWIGIERQPVPSDVKNSHPLRSQDKDQMNTEDIPLPLAQEMNDGPYAASAPSSAPFDYVDGTRVQNKVWQMWGPKANKHSDERQRRNCVALTYDRDVDGWRWHDHDCGARLGYVCQYFILNFVN